VNKALTSKSDTMNALILVDIQNDFLPGGALAVPDGDAVIAVANALIPLFGLVVATQDWHPADHRSFAANHPGKAVGELIELGTLPQVLWPIHCVQGEAGAEFATRLNLPPAVRVFQKGKDPYVDSYSGFFDNGRLRSTGLGEFLKGAGVTTVFILGLATDYCVQATALDARFLGFETLLVKDGCRGVDLTCGDVTRALETMAKAGVKMTDAAGVMALLSA
jgi:nicotinamidase/pyrazinamidase